VLQNWRQECVGEEAGGEVVRECGPFYNGRKQGERSALVKVKGIGRRRGWRSMDGWSKNLTGEIGLIGHGG